MIVYCEKYVHLIDDITGMNRLIILLRRRISEIVSGSVERSLVSSEMHTMFDRKF
jgi:hypothetical protein